LKIVNNTKNNTTNKECIWNNDWIKDKKLQKILTLSIIDKNIIKKLEETIKPEEYELFLSQNFYI